MEILEFVVEMVLELIGLAMLEAGSAPSEDCGRNHECDEFSAKRT